MSVIINCPEDFDTITIPYNEYIEFKCSKCGKNHKTKYRPCNKEKLKRMLCADCAYKQSSIDIYGVDNPSKLKEIRDKVISTCKERYGGDGIILRNNAIREKGKATKLEKYGDENFTNREKCVETMESRYGVKYPMQVKEGKENFEKAMQAKYGVSYSGESKELLDKTKETKLKLYGDEFYTNHLKGFQTKLIRYGDGNYTNIDKSRRTMIERYGADNYMSTKEFKEKSEQTRLRLYGTSCPNFSHTYLFNGIQFDSSWELYLYLYCMIMGISIFRNNTEYIEYNYNGETHKYYPDFKVFDNFGFRYVEVKGNQLMIDGSLGSKLKGYKRNGLDIEKQKCMEKNNVLLLTEKDMIPIIQAVNVAFSKKYIASFKILFGGFVYGDFVFSSVYGSILATSYNPFNINTDSKYTENIYFNNDGAGLTPFDIIAR